MKEKIAIVGASIAGRICAILLNRLGYDITVFEKSKNNEAIVDRGAGMWLPPILIHQLINQNILSKDFRHLNIHERPIYSYNQDNDQEYLLTSHPINSAAVHWLALYEDLRKHSPESDIIYNAQITQVTKINDDNIDLVINNSDHYNFNYCIFADGVHSFGRNHLFPEIQPTFANTTVWRGTLNNFNEKTLKHLNGRAVFYVCERGHLLLYLIPTHGTQDLSNNCLVNWLFYEHTNSSHPLFQGNPEKATQNVVKGTMIAPYRLYLHSLAEKYFPPLVRDVILETAEPFTQAAHELLIPSYAIDNMCVIGDSGILLRPHTAAGATKAIQDALALGETLEKCSDIKLAFKDWSNKQHIFGHNQFKIGQNLGRLFVTNMPDWSKIKKQEMDNLWEKASGEHCWYATKTKYTQRILSKT